jgi:TorA maturation chaperone TorD
MTQDHIALYCLLAQALVYPDKHFVANVQATIGKINLELFDDARLQQSAFVRALSELATLPLDQIQGEYTRLFINAFPRVPCPPYESTYCEGILLGEAAMQVAEEYRAWGLAVESEPVDHVGAELEFVAFLLTLNTREACMAANAFARDHLARWLPRFAEDVIRESRLEFYRQVGRLLAAVLPREPIPV